MNTAALLVSSGFGPYVPWDVSLFYDAMINLRSSMGVGFNIGFWIFTIVSGVFIIIKLVGMIVR